jgi:hypothetical protein
MSRRTSGRWSGRNSNPETRRVAQGPFLASTIIELVGPAGAGKSTLLRELRARDERICPSAAIGWTSYLRDAPALIPLFVELHRPFDVVRYREMKRALHLNALYRLVHQVEASRVVVLDEGPMYFLTRQLVLGPSALENEAFCSWWRSTLERWADSLSLVVWLDADTACLTTRIRQRPGRQPIPDLADDSLVPFLDRYRGAFARVIGTMARPRGPRVLSIDTAQLKPAAIAERVLTAMHDR